MRRVRVVRADNHCAHRVNITEDGERALIELAHGDMRRVLNVLQSTSLAFDIVNEVNVYSCCGHPLTSDIETIMQSLLNSDASTCYASRCTFVCVRVTNTDYRNSANASRQGSGAGRYSHTGASVRA